MFKNITALALLTVAVTGTATAADISPEAIALAKAVADKLAPAKTIKLTATHKLDSAVGSNAKLDKGPLNITVKRPNQCYVLQSAGDETRELAFDGKTFCLMHPVLKVHALEPLKAASIEEFADQLDERFGFRPPVAELLANDLPKQLFANATSAKVTGREWSGWTRCERLHIEQEGLTGDLWIGVKDRLPHRMLLTFTGVKGSPKWDIRLSEWELGATVDESLFSKRPAEGSQKTKLLKSR